MAQIPRKLLDELTEELNAFSLAGRQMVENALARLVPQFEDADGIVPPENVAPLRAAAVEVMEAVCGEMADLSAARTAEFYDAVRRLAGAAGRYSALAESGRIPAATEGAVRALVQRVADTGMTVVFARDLGDRVDYEVKKASGDCIVVNSLGDPSKPRWARIPTGAETCPFCTMLASRGFVYHSAAKAGSKGHYHPSCDCRIVPGFKDMTVEGYDTEVYYRQYVDDLQSGRLNLKTVNGSTSHVMHWGSVEFESVGDISRFLNAAEDVEDLQLRCALVEQEWPKTGLSDKYRRQVAQAMSRKRASLAAERPEVDPGPVYEKPREALEDHERAGIDKLWANGIRPVVKLEDPIAPANIDLEIDGDKWELKCPSGSNKRAIESNLRKAKRQFEKSGTKPVNVVLSCIEYEIDRNELSREVKRQMEAHRIDAVKIIHSDGSIEEIES